MNSTLKMYQQSQNQARAIHDQNPLLGGIIDRAGAGGSGSAGIDLSLFAFGVVSISGADVTINAGEVSHGVRSIITVAGATKTIVSDYSYIWVEYTLGGSGVIADPSTTRPVSNSSTLRVWLALFRFVEDEVSVHTVGHVGNIIIPGVFA